jgi:hypothetical protein
VLGKIPDENSLDRAVFEVQRNFPFSNLKIYETMRENQRIQPNEIKKNRRKGKWQLTPVKGSVLQ